MHSPLTNCFLRPRSSAAHHRRDDSSAAAAVEDFTSSFHRDFSSSASPPLSSASPRHSAVLRPLTSPDYTSPRSSNVASAIYLSSLAFPPPGSSPVAGSSFPSSVNSSPHGHRSPYLSPFPSPFALNVPLRRSSYRCVVTAEDHASTLALHGNLLYSGLRTGDISVSKHSELLERARFGIGDGVVRALLVTDDKIFTGHRDHKIRVWRRPDARRSKYQVIETLPSTKDYFLNLFRDTNYIQIRRHHKRVWIQHVDSITAFAIGQEGMLLYSASWDKTVKVWRLSNMRCIESIKAHDDAVNDIVVGSDGLLYTASADRSVKVWKCFHQHLLVSTLHGHKAAVNALAIRADGRTLYSGGSDCYINVWERHEGEGFQIDLAKCLKGHRLPVLCLAVSGPLLCSGSADKSIRIWRRASTGSYSCLSVLEGHTGPIKCVSISLNTLRSCFAYSTSLDSTTKVWSVIFDNEDEFSSFGPSPQLTPEFEFDDAISGYRQPQSTKPS